MFTDQHIILKQPECLTCCNLIYVIKTKFFVKLKKLLRIFYWLFLETISCLCDEKYLQKKENMALFFYLRDGTVYSGY